MFENRYFQGFAVILFAASFSACGGSGSKNVQSAVDEPKPADAQKVVVDVTSAEKTTPDKTNPELPQEEIGGVEGGVEGGVPGGVVGGMVVGVPGGRATVNDPPTRPDSPIPFGAGMTRPKQISGPSVAEGITVQVSDFWVGRCVIKEDGTVTECHVLKSLPGIDKALLRNLEAQKYTPVIYQDKPQRVYYTFKVKFK